jgi:D-alanyl-D-alanine carboxypeptidase
MLILAVTIFCGCSLEQKQHSSEKTEPAVQHKKPTDESPNKNDSVDVVTDPQSIEVLVNNQYKLKENYVPKDLVYPNVPFIFKDKIEKRKMRKVAADALEQLFSGAKNDGIFLAGVSAYRSYSTQEAVFNHYVKEDGEKKAETYSALPGTSEHQTGLAIDLSGSDGKCAAESCFGGTKEANWLADNAYKFGFIVRYPENKENITGYKYEPWHIRFVGKEIAKEVSSKNITLEEYYHKTLVSK